MFNTARISGVRCCLMYDSSVDISENRNAALQATLSDSHLIFVISGLLSRFRSLGKSISWRKRHLCTIPERMESLQSASHDGPLTLPLPLPRPLPIPLPTLPDVALPTRAVPLTPP